MLGFKHWFVPPLPATGELRVQGIGVQESMPPCTVNRPSGTPDYLFMYFYDEVSVEQDGAIREAGPRSFKIWEPRVPQRYGNPSARWAHTWIHCEGPWVADRLREVPLPLNRIVAISDPALVERHLLEIHEELTTQAEPDPAIVQNVLQNLLRRLARAFDAEHPSNRVPERFLEVKKHMEAHFVEPLTLGMLAERAHLSVPHFSAEFRRHFEVSPIEYLIRLRLHAAAYHLRNVNYRVSEVGGLVGYDDIYYFSKLFKKRYGISPRAMRARMAATLSEAPPPGV